MATNNNDEMGFCTAHKGYVKKSDLVTIPDTKQGVGSMLSGLFGEQGMAAPVQKTKTVCRKCLDAWNARHPAPP